LVFLILALALAACVGRPAADATGEEIFLQVCSNCHSEDLSGGIGPPIGPDSNAAGRPDEFLRITIEHGRGRMPSFATTLNAGQVDVLIEFLRREQHE
jgi:mono/diheme cytochrome c family protein